VYLVQNTYQAASMGFVRLWRTKPARGRLQMFVGKGRRPFLTYEAGLRKQPGFGVFRVFDSEGA